MVCELLQVMPALGFETAMRFRWRELREWHSAAGKVRASLRGLG